MRKSNARVVIAYCTCPARLSGCCNHKHILPWRLCALRLKRRGLYWKTTEVESTEEVQFCLMNTSLCIARKSVQYINSWDCLQSTRRIIDPNKARMLQKNLYIIEILMLQSFASVLPLLTETGSKHLIKRVCWPFMVHHFCTNFTWRACPIR